MTRTTKKPDAPATPRKVHASSPDAARPEPRVVLDGEEESAGTIFDEAPAARPSVTFAPVGARGRGRQQLPPVTTADRLEVDRAERDEAAARLLGPDRRTAAPPPAAPSSPRHASPSAELRPGPLEASRAAACLPVELLAELATREPGAAMREIGRARSALDAAEGAAIRAAYLAAGWRDTAAATRLGITRRTLQGLTDPGRRHEAIGREARTRRAELGGIRPGRIPGASRGPGTAPDAIPGPSHAPSR